MHTSLHQQLLTLSLKMDTGLQAIDQLSQLLVLLITELQGTGQTVQGSERSVVSRGQSPLLEALLDQLSIIRQDLHQSAQPITDLENHRLVPLRLEELMPPHFPEDHNHLVSDRSLGSLHHKDVLEDDDSFGLERTTNSAVPAEMQVRRLMAQLTAAYNRIAALEEQLLSSHRPSYASQDVQNAQS